MKISKAKCDYIIERIEELRKVYGDYEMQTESIAFIFNDYDDVFYLQTGSTFKDYGSGTRGSNHRTNC